MNNNPDINSFPDDFAFGVATAAYQIEGAWNEDGKGECVWDRFCRTPGRIKGNASGDIACDHYHLWQTDLDLLSELGVDSYRFSIAWSRILPLGEGPVNHAGLDFYKRLCDALLARGIRPLATLWHADQPQALEDKGGWPWRGIVKCFGDYADIIFRELGDRVHDWGTLNEANCFLFQGYGSGNCAPGQKDWKTVWQAVHHALLAHAEAVRRFRESGRTGNIGLVHSLDRWAPISDRPEDVLAAMREETRNIWWFLDAIHGHGYPQDFFHYLGANAPKLEPGDEARLFAPGDFLGINYYSRCLIGMGDTVTGQAAKGESFFHSYKPYSPGLVEVMARCDDRYGRGVYIITENGFYNGPEPTGPDGVTQDSERVDYLRDHIAELANGIRNGIDVRGYYVWTLMDNFEWGEGYNSCLGLFRCDRTTLSRTPKLSALWYRDFLRSVRATRS